MEEYKVPKQRASVLVEIPPHTPEERFLFLSPFAQSHQGAETISDIFGVPQRFLPLFRATGEVVLVRREAISWIKVGDPRRTEWYYYEHQIGAPQAAVQVEFADAAIMEGRICLIGPIGGQRVIDVVNRKERFLQLERDDDLFLVNLDHVVSITVKE